MIKHSNGLSLRQYKKKDFTTIIENNIFERL